MANPSHLQITKHDTQAFPTRMTEILLRLASPIITREKKPLPSGSPKLTPPSSIKASCDVREHQVEDVWLYELQARGHGQPSQRRHSVNDSRHIYCFAGSSFRQPPSPDHWKMYAHLAKELSDCTVTIISPPLAPNSPAPTAFPQLERLLQSLLRKHEAANQSVTFLGDSSGGCLVLALILSVLRDPTMPGPRSIFLICPSVDHSHTNPAIKQLERKDPLLSLSQELKTSKDWAGEWSLTDPRISPLYADLTVLKARDINVHGVTAGHDLLTPDALLFRDKLSQLGVVGQWLEWDKQIHCFPLTFSYGIREGVAGMRWIVDVLTIEGTPRGRSVA